MGLRFTLTQENAVDLNGLLAVMDQERFRSGKLSTRYIQDEFPDGFHGLTPDARQTLVLGRYDDAWRQAHHVRVATLSARGRASGIPRLQWHDDAAWLVWTDVAGDVPGLHGARVRWP